MSRIRARRLIPAVLSLALSSLLLPAIPPSAAPARLTFARRLAAQEALERVYWKHRTWPAGDVSKRPRFEQAVPAAAIRARVEDYLRKSEALDRIWRRPITAAQLQAEIDRMAAKTRAPEVLRELFEALDDDPDLIAECLARPHLADRLIHDWYAYDGRFHAEARAKAEKGLEALERGADIRRLDATVSTMDEREAERRSAVATGVAPQWGRAELNPAGPSGRATGPPAREWIEESAESFYVRHSTAEPEDGPAQVIASWPKRPFDDWWKEQAAALDPLEPETSEVVSVPSLLATPTCTDDTWTPLGGDVSEPRRFHSAVWTGSEMIVWGGAGFPGYLNTGGRYDPATDTWTLFRSNSKTLPARQEHVAVWTGTEMIVWGGWDGTWRNEGARYNPVTNSWIPMTITASTPTGRAGHSAIWTGTEMIIWGGYNGTAYLNSGGRYNPATDTWVATSMGANVPSIRSLHAAVWTGSRMIVWGGYNGSFDPQPGGRYDPATDTWLPTSTTGAPQGRHDLAAAWIGTKMLVWGGTTRYYDDDTGGLYDPVADTWEFIFPTQSTPAARDLFTSVWTGTKLIIWGGEGDGGAYRFNSSGGVYDPASNTWSATRNDATTPGRRVGHTAVWTGSEMIVFGGWYDLNGTYPTRNDGGRYDPSSDTWVPVSPGADHTEPRTGQSAVWTGYEMLVWGGRSISATQLRSGGAYEPATDSWRALPIDAATPSARQGARAVWTGKEMIIIGGFSLNGVPTYGGLYDPSADSWRTLSAGAGAPSVSTSSTAVWTGTEMIVWKGPGTGGGRFDPVTDTWAPVNSGLGAPVARSGHSAIWTGTEMIIWGGFSGDDLADGARYDPATDTWSPVSAGPNAPGARRNHAAVWTGDEMIVWGGFHDFDLDDGGRYDPASDTWSPMAWDPITATARSNLTAVWTGSEMLFWGGSGLDTGARYDPAADSWSPTRHDSTTPGPRTEQSEVWDGTHLLVWGGLDNGVFLANGRAYCACSGVPDTTYYLDHDRDGRGDPSTATLYACNQPPGWTLDGTDCDDDDPTVYPGAPQICDGLNNDCDDPSWPDGTPGEIDEDLDGWTICAGDCDDAHAAVYPGAPQLCDGQNNDCADPGWPSLTGTNEADDDGDTISECAGDCLDSDASVYPGAPQLCDGINTDCNDPMWPSVPVNEADADLDGWRICAGDCDDAHPSVYPGAPQICDGLNNDCNDPSWPAGAPGEVDADLDGWQVCAGDCDDTHAAVYPGAPQICDGLDNDCSAPGWPTVPPDEIDADGDGRPMCDDCADADDRIWAVPGYVNNLAMSVTPQQYIRLSWSQPADPGAVSVTYDVIRSGINGNYTTAATCVETDDGSDTTALDATPLPGQVYYFLVRVRNGCPGGTAVAPDSSGQPRTVRTCP